jgi:RimJ/RimL family protein N-acetyltransferase
VSGLVARAATTEDADLLLGWRNDADTRRWSRSGDPVAPDRHAAWLTTVLSDPVRHLWVLERDGEPVVTVRHDRVRQGRYEVSVTVAPHRRGEGLATEALAAAGHALAQQDPPPLVIEAHVQQDNAASLAVFGAAGYLRAADDEDGLVVLELIVTP